MSKENAEKQAKALDFANQLLRDQPALSRLDVVEQTALRFDLSPLEEEWLLRQLTDGERTE
jgi:hypothetical protein